MLFFFYVFAIASIASALGVLILRDPVYCAMSLVATFFCLAGVYVLMNAEFVAVIQVLVYAGAIMVLFLFVIMLLNSKDRSNILVSIDPFKIAASIVGFGILIQMVQVFTSYGVLTLGEKGKYSVEVLNDVGAIAIIGELLFTDYILPFEIISVLLLVAVIGAVVIAKRPAKKDL